MTIVKCIHNILHNRGLLSRRWSITPYPLSVGCTQWLPPKGYSMEKGGQLMEKPHKHNLSQRQMIKVNINSDKSWQYYIPSIWYTENGTFTSMVFFPKIYNSISSHRKKKSNKFKWGEGNILPNIWPVLLKILNLSKTNHKYLRNCHRQQKPKEFGQINLM